MSARRDRDLRPEEAHLWRRVAESTVPLHPDRASSQGPRTAQSRPNPLRDAAPVEFPGDFRIGACAPAAVSGHDTAPSVSEALSRAPVRMDRKAYQRMSRGKLLPEARIDLHGMTLAAAQPALTGFVYRAQASGKRLILVITGKGRADRDTGGPIPERAGVLKREVPAWLRRPPLSPLVLQVTEAHRRHGGSGAYYVYLRRPGR